MAASVRVVLSPVTFEEGRRSRVRGATLALNAGGLPGTKVTRAVQPASLVFSIAFLEQARVASTGTFSDVGTLSGKISRTREGTPQFEIQGNIEGAPPEDKLTSAFSLWGDGKSVRGASEKPLRLQLPAAPPGAMFLELGVELRVAGNLEAAREVNDRLDAAVTRNVEVALVDAEGKPMPSEPYEAYSAGCEVLRGCLDDSGRALIEGLLGGQCRILFPLLDDAELIV